MANRLLAWAILIWTAFMAIGIFAAYLGIGGDCSGLSGGDLTTCQADAWGRGMVGLALLAILWLVVVAPLGLLWQATRRKRPQPFDERRDVGGGWPTTAGR